LRIYGACINPAIIIGDHTYKVNCSVNAGEYLTIDSTTKKIYITGTDGTVTNVFSKRDRENYIFEKISVGMVTVAWGGGYGFDLILLEERSEPKWT
jgi:phage-related protein